MENMYMRKRLAIPTPYTKLCKNVELQYTCAKFNNLTFGCLLVGQVLV